MVFERCDERGSCTTGRSTETRELEFKKGTPERVPATIPENPVRRNHTPETPNERISLRDKGLRTILTDREGTRKCDHRVAPSGSIDEEGRGCDHAPGSQLGLSVVCLENSSGTRWKSNGVYETIHRFSYPVSVRQCIVLQRERRRQVRQQSSSCRGGSENGRISRDSRSPCR